MKTKPERKRPAVTFYPKEWIWDIELRQCSPAARGLWVDLLCIMHEGTPYGHLTAPEDLVLRMTGLTADVYHELLADLEAEKPSGKRVAYRTDDGILYSKRMVRDEEDRISRKANGGKGGNPGLVNHGRLTELSESPVNHGRLSETEKKSIEDKDSKKKEDARAVEFRDLYPEHRRDNAGVQLFLSSSPETQDAILAGLRLWVKSTAWAEDGGKYVNRASNFITEKIYEMKPQAVAKTKPAPYFDARKAGIID